VQFSPDAWAVPVCTDVNEDNPWSKDTPVPIVLVAITTLMLSMDTASALASSDFTASATAGVLTNSKGFDAVRPMKPVTTPSILTPHSAAGGVHASPARASQWHLLLAALASRRSACSALYDDAVAGHAKKGTKPLSPPSSHTFKPKLSVITLETKAFMSSWQQDFATCWNPFSSSGASRPIRKAAEHFVSEPWVASDKSADIDLVAVIFLEQGWSMLAHCATLNSGRA